MEIGIGLPNAIARTTRPQLIDWARAAEEAGFNTLGTIDRLVFDSYEPIVALSAAAAVTERIRLATDVVLGPLRQNPAMIAKQVLSSTRSPAAAAPSSASPSAAARTTTRSPTSTCRPRQLDRRRAPQDPGRLGRRR